MSPDETARTVASALGKPTTHPGTARLARDLADALTRPIDPAPHDPEPFDECAGPMPTEELRYYSLVEKTDGPHKGKVWRSEWKSPAEVASINAGIHVMKWEEAPFPDNRPRI